MESGRVDWKWHEAVIFGHGERVAQLLQASPWLIDEADSAGRTALHFAAINGNHEMVAQLLSFKSNLNARDVKGFTALHHAVIEGHRQVVEQLLAVMGSLDAMDHDGWTALHHAAAEGHAMLVELFLAHPRINIDIRDLKRKTALHHAASLGKEGVVALLLADPRTRVNAGDECGCTALHCAAHEGKVKVVASLLVDERTQVNSRDEYGRTALQLAVKVQSVEVVMLLLTQPSIAIDDGQFILFLAIQEGHDQLLARLRSTRPASDFLVWMHSVDGFGRNALHLAIRYSRDELVSEMLTLSPSLIDVLNPWGHNPLQSAVCHGSEKSMELVLAARPEWLSSVDPRSGDTLLHLAVRSSPRLPPRAFLRLWQLRAADVRIPNTLGKTPFAAAVAKANDFAVDLMQWHLCLDEIMAVTSQWSRFRPVLEGVCSDLAVLLNRDVMGTVYEYLGFERQMGEKAKSQSLSPLPIKISCH